MGDLLVRLHKNIFTAPFARALGLPHPVTLARAAGGYVAAPLAGLQVRYGASGGHALDAILAALRDQGAEPLPLPLPEAGAPGAGPADIVVLDATGCRTVDAMRLLYGVFHPLMRRIAVNGRVLIVVCDPADPMICGDAVAAGLARGAEGFMRSLAKELGPRGIAVNLLYAGAGAGGGHLAGPVQFFCGRRSTYVTGQAVRVSPAVALAAAAPAVQALAGKVALVTGAARGIGLATAQRLREEGARVVALDVPAAQAALEAACGRYDFTPLVLDIAEAAGPRALAAFVRERFGVIDIVVHNAGVTRDRKLANMKAPYWDQVMDINFGAVAAIDAALCKADVLGFGARIVCLASISGVAGNVGQTNYAMSKAALIGYVAARSAQLAPRGICINAVAPGFIETPMTAAMPFLLRELGRRANALKQGGMPRDVAELVVFLATPGAAGITGQTIRACGQALVGA